MDAGSNTPEMRAMLLWTVDLMEHDAYVVTNEEIWIWRWRVIRDGERKEEDLTGKMDTLSLDIVLKILRIPLNRVAMKMITLLATCFKSIVRFYNHSTVHTH